LKPRHQLLHSKKAQTAAPTLLARTGTTIDTDRLVSTGLLKSESANSIFIDPIGCGTGNPGEYQRQAMEDSDNDSDDYQDSEEEVLPVIQLKSISPKRTWKRGNKRGKKKQVKSPQHLDNDAMSDIGENEQMTLNSTIDNDLTDIGYSSEEDALPTKKILIQQNRRKSSIATRWIIPRSLLLRVMSSHTMDF
jgi:hypothetical protein